MKDTIVIIFSKNRAFQCHLTLSTFFARCKESDKTTVVVLYKADEQHENSYEKLEKEWMWKADIIPELDFREDLLFMLEENKYVLFVVDDCIFTHDFSLSEICQDLHKHPNAIGFSLRLGKNTNYCYTMNKAQNIPLELVSTPKRKIAYNWLGADLDFGYPAEVSSSIYRVSDFMKIFRQYGFGNPNALESLMNVVAKSTNKMPFLLCYKQSVAFCNPCNKVQTVAPNNRVGIDVYYTPENLLSLYDQGVRIDPEMFHGFVSNSTHMEVSLIHD